MQMVIGIKNTAPNEGLIRSLKTATNAENTVQSANAIYTVPALQKYIERRWYSVERDLSACIYITWFFETCRQALIDGYVILIKEMDRHDALFDFIADWTRSNDNIKIILTGGTT